MMDEIDNFTVTISENTLDGNIFRMSTTILDSRTRESKAIKVLAEHIASLESENASLRERTRWIPVGERLPEIDDYYLVKVSNREVLTVARYYWHDKGFSEAYSGWSINVTCWMPLPEAPKEDA